MSNMVTVHGGIREFVFGATSSQREDCLAFWAMLGFKPIAAGNLDARAAKALYGHKQPLQSVRLAHPGSNSYGTGMVRLQFWETLRNQGLESTHPIIPGSRWMGMYTHDVLQLRDSFSSAVSQERWNSWISPLVAAPLVKPVPEHDFFQPFVGLREQLVFCDDFRLAFIQRAGFDRPGFGTFDDSLPYKNTEGSHANIIQPQNEFSTEFYKTVFGYETAPFGEAHDSGEEAPTIAALRLDDGERFTVERTRAPECPTAYLQVYSSHLPHKDRNDYSRAGSKGLCLYVVYCNDAAHLAEQVISAGGKVRSGPLHDEFGQQALYFDAPDGYSWLAIADSPRDAGE